ncbi:hypothetical protein [Pseudonocardia sp. H11422]|uniref:hypothetical protein n=1 Tax=Pseudonocardia sp. H11422 TaxID=2835866 RepID=UPI00292D368D|nr:hypothetical protein [Pseudonocardia sp. H11422]
MGTGAGGRARRRRERRRRGRPVAPHPGRARRRWAALAAAAAIGLVVRGGGLRTDEFDTVDISAERWDGDPRHSQISLVCGTLS